MLKITILLYNYKSNHSLWFGTAEIKGSPPPPFPLSWRLFFILIFNRLITILRFCSTKLDF
ncbi:hypothetical protein HPNQ4044_0537 [Helicobacter pylori NQ4044]|uniref:Uncharacterized protein n=1 Tax=Helicobacter pylori NQ4044 TaxID=992028 RepID=I9ZNQ3_HELPX|nr:hypothetical protein HPNQ4044_0537 [Helicobacter pylori NQ4044]